MMSDVAMTVAPEAAGRGSLRGRAYGHICLFVVLAGIMVVPCFRYGLWRIPVLATSVDFSTFDAGDQTNLSRIAAGTEYVTHSYSFFIALQCLAAFLSRRYRENEYGPALMAAAAGIVNLFILDVPQTRYGVFSYVFDLPIFFATIGACLVLLPLALWRYRAKRKAVPVIAALFTMAYLFDSTVVHLAYVKSTFNFLRLAQGWSAANMEHMGPDPATSCRERGYLCLVPDGTGGAKPLAGSLGIHVSEDLADYVSSELRPYGILDPQYPTGRRFDVLTHTYTHRNLKRMQYGGTKVAGPDGKPLVVVDMLTSPMSYIMANSFLGMHLIVYITIWSLILVYVFRFHSPRREAVAPRIGAGPPMRLSFPPPIARYLYRDESIGFRRFSSIMAGIFVGAAAATMAMLYAYWPGYSFVTPDLRDGLVLATYLRLATIWTTLMIAVALCLVTVDPLRFRPALLRAMPPVLAATVALAYVTSHAVAIVAALNAALVVASFWTGLRSGRFPTQRRIMSIIAASVPFMVYAHLWILQFGTENVYRQASLFIRRFATPSLQTGIDASVAALPNYMETASILGILPYLLVWLLFGSVLVSYHRPAATIRTTA